VRASSIRYIGKEANRLEDVESGLVGDIDDVLTEYVDPIQNPLRTLVLPVLEDLTSRVVGDRIGVNHTTVVRIRNGTAPNPSVRQKLWALAEEIAVSQPVADRSPQAKALRAEVRDRLVP
jgi:hypothetical protein